MLILGIDPGANTGVATFVGGALVELETIEPHRIAALILSRRPGRVIYEDSRIESFAWTTVKRQAAALKMARNIGKIDAWCKLICGVCGDLGVPVHGISPKTKGAKVNAEDFAKLTGWSGLSNEHTRDAAVVAWPYRRAGA